MSNTLAIAAVTSTVRHLLQRALESTYPGPVGGATVHTVRLDQLSTGDLVGTPCLNVLLYQVTPDHAGNLTDLSTRDASGALVRRPNAAVDLHYLITASGDESALEGQRLLARALVALAATPVLTRDVIEAARTAHQTQPETAFLASADLADQIERVKLSPVPLSLEDHTRLWGLFHEATFQPSIAYRATVVLLEADMPTRRPLPVRTRLLTVQAGAQPHLASASPADSVLAPATGVELVVRGGSLLRGPTEPTVVQVGPARLVPAPGSTPAELRVTLTADVPAGIHSVRVLQLRPSTGPGGPPERVVGASNALALTVHPGVAVARVTAEEVSFALAPPVVSGQRSVVHLDPLGDDPDDGAPRPRSPLALAVEPVPPGAAPRAEATVDRELIQGGGWLVRLETDGIMSIPESSGGAYSGPRLDLT